jgi:hypothetical protein
MAMAQAAPPPATFFSFDFPGATNTQATAINVAGKIVGRYISTDGVQHGFLLNGTQFKSLDVGATFTDVTWINRYDQISGSYNTSDGKTHGFVMSAGVFTTIDYPGAQTTLGFGVGDNGDVVGIAIDSNGVLHGYLLRHGMFSLVNFPGASSTLPAMVIGQTIVGGYFVGNAGQGFLRSGGVYTSIGCPGDGNVFLSGIDPAGEMVGGVDTSDGAQHGVLVRAGHCILIDFPGGSNTYANGIINGGTIVGRYTDASGKVHGFLRVGAE